MDVPPRASPKGARRVPTTEQLSASLAAAKAATAVTLGVAEAFYVLRILEASGTAGRQVAHPRQSDRPSGRVAA